MLTLTLFLSRVEKQYDNPLQRYIFNTESIGKDMTSPQSLMALTSSPEEVMIEERANKVASKVEMTHPRYTNRIYICLFIHN